MTKNLEEEIMIVILFQILRVLGVGQHGKIVGKIITIVK